MFLHLSVSHSVHRGGVPGEVHPLARYTPGQVPPFPAGTPPWTGTPSPAGAHPGQVHPSLAGTPPLGRYTPRHVHPPGAVHAGRYGKQAGGTHPAGMHSCASCCYLTLSKYVHEEQVQKESDESY